MSSRRMLLGFFLVPLTLPIGIALGQGMTLPNPNRAESLAPTGMQAPVRAAIGPEHDAREVHLPSIGRKGWGADSCVARIHVQALGATGAIQAGFPPGPTTRFLLLQWGADGSCPTGAAVPLKVNCSGFMVPGSSWTVTSPQIDPEARSAALFSLAIDALPPGTGGNPGCAEIAAALTTRPGAYQRFLEAYRSGAAFPGLEPGWRKGGPIAVTVERGCGPAGAEADAVASADYAGIGADRAMAERQDDGSHTAWFAGLAGGADSAGRSLTELSIQNLGLDCATVQVFIHMPGRPQGDEPSPPADCQRPRLCATFAVSPGTAARLPLADCAPAPGTMGVSLQSTEMIAVVADSYDGRVFASIAAEPKAYTGWSGLLPALPASWRPVVQVLNPHPDLQAKVKVYLLDRSGDVITSLASLICPQATGSFTIPAPSGLQQPWTGRIRVVSQEWWTPGSNTLGNTVPVIASIDLLPPAVTGGASGSVSALGLELEPLEAGGPDVTILGLPRIGKKSKLALAARAEDGIFAVANLATAPGYTDFTLYVYDANGLLDFTCNKLAQQGLEYVDLSTWGYVNPGFTGSAVISAAYWEHLAYDAQGRLTGNRAHLAAWQLRHSPDDDPARWQGAKAQALEGVAVAAASEWLELLPDCARQGPVIRVPTPTSTAGTPVIPSATPTPPEGTPVATTPTASRTPEPPPPTFAPTVTPPMGRQLYLPRVNG
ncbi:MAG: hypothetical protein IPJ58_17830 [Ardenticatenia bacterium]|nr:hypothetical protein [Ardenticatenia bacterium]